MAIDLIARRSCVGSRAAGLEHGFVRVKCNGCRHEHLVDFSCKRRGFCPSCGARRYLHVPRSRPEHGGLLDAPTPLVPQVQIDESILASAPGRYECMPGRLTSARVIRDQGRVYVEHRGNIQVRDREAGADQPRCLLELVNVGVRFEPESH
jgi:ribosomal protein S27E